MFGDILWMQNIDNEVNFVSKFIKFLYTRTSVLNFVFCQKILKFEESLKLNSERRNMMWSKKQAIPSGEKTWG